MLCGWTAARLDGWTARRTDGQTDGRFLVNKGPLIQGGAKALTLAVLFFLFRDVQKHFFGGGGGFINLDSGLCICMYSRGHIRVAASLFNR